VSKDPTTRLQEHPVKNTSWRHHQSERPGAQLSRAVGIRPQPDQVAHGKLMADHLPFSGNNNVGFLSAKGTR
jgi:hypothetical protein